MTFHVPEYSEPQFYAEHDPKTKITRITLRWYGRDKVWSVTECITDVEMLEHHDAIGLAEAKCWKQRQQIMEGSHEH